MSCLLSKSLVSAECLNSNNYYSICTMTRLLKANTGVSISPGKNCNWCKVAFSDEHSLRKHNLFAPREFPNITAGCSRWSTRSSHRRDLWSQGLYFRCKSTMFSFACKLHATAVMQHPFSRKENCKYFLGFSAGCVVFQNICVFK